MVDKIVASYNNFKIMNKENAITIMIVKVIFTDI